MMNDRIRLLTVTFDGIDSYAIVSRDGIAWEFDWQYWDGVNWVDTIVSFDTYKEAIDQLNFLKSQDRDSIEPPYFVEFRQVTDFVRTYNRQYGNYRMCECGHHYIRHFDQQSDVGCKYCQCVTFVEDKMA